MEDLLIDLNEVIENKMNKTVNDTGVGSFAETSKTLTPKRKAEIQSVVDGIRNDNCINTAQFDLIEFLTHEYSFEIQSRIINDDTTGLLLVDDNDIVPGSSSHRVIVINKKLIDDVDYIKKRRFICAHEFGHFILHKKDQKVYAMRDTKNKSNIIEQEAEYFAYCLLLPSNLINNLLTREDIKPFIEELQEQYDLSMDDIVSNLFNVTKKKAAARLADMGQSNQ